MALKPCRECKKEISDSAKKCPNCGVDNPALSETQMKVAKIVATVASISILLTFFAICASPSKDTSPGLERREIKHGDIFGCTDKATLGELDGLKSDDALYRRTLSEHLASKRCRKMRAGRMAEVKAVDTAKNLSLVRQVLEGETEFYWVTSEIF